MLSRTTSSGETAFPWKLHMVLDESAFGGFEDTISWIGDTAFKVHDPIKFEETIMKRYFNQTQYKSFQRQLNIYGFTRVKTAGKATGSYSHPLFIRGNPDACSYMVRTKIKKKGIRKNMNGKAEQVPLTRRVSVERHSYNESKAPLHSNFMMNRRNKMNRNVSPSFDMARSNNFIEPTPFDSLSSSNNSAISQSTVVTCDGNSYVRPMPAYSSQQDSIRPGMMYSMDHSNNTRRVTPILEKQTLDNGRFLERIRPTYYNNVDLDLDTVFDDDSNNYGNNNGNYAGRPSVGFVSMNKNGLVDTNFQAVQNSLSDLIDHDQRTISTTTRTRAFY